MANPDSKKRTLTEILMETGKQGKELLGGFANGALYGLLMPFTMPTALRMLIEHDQLALSDAAVAADFRHVVNLSGMLTGLILENYVAGTFIGGDGIYSDAVRSVARYAFVGGNIASGAFELVRKAKNEF